MVELILATPLTVGLLCILVRSKKVAELLSLLGTLFSFCLAVLLIVEVSRNGPRELYGGLIYVDCLGAFFLNLTLLTGVAVATYSIGYMDAVIEGEHREWELSRYYLLLNLFIFTMTVVTVTGNLGILWIAIEATTLVSAFFVGFYNDKPSLEAAWKYLIICTVGITFALFGTVLFYYSSLHVSAELRHTLSWVKINGFAEKLDSNIIKTAFVFILIGYGTKAGLAPMHTWLPDAHSQAPTPVSALLSAILLKCSLYAILRFYIIAKKCLGTEYLNGLFLIFGIFSLTLATFFILTQRDIKRLLAFSSLEHIGIVFTGIGFGGWFGVYGALLHTLNHALVKTLMFFVGGNLSIRYHTKDMDKIRGAVRVMPLTGVALLLGSFALAGAPPFNMFLSEITILSAGFTNGNTVASLVFLTSLVVIFAGLVRHATNMAFNKPSEGIREGDVSRWSTIPCMILLVLVFILGIYIPGFLDNVLNQLVKIIGTQ